MPRAELYKEEFQAIEIGSIGKPLCKMAVTVREPGLVPYVFQNKEADQESAGHDE